MPVHIPAFPEGALGDDVLPLGDGQHVEDEKMVSVGSRIPPIAPLLKSRAIRRLRCPWRKLLHLNFRLLLMLAVRSRALPMPTYMPRFWTLSCRLTLSRFCRFYKRCSKW